MPERVEVWVDLSLPPTASLPRGDRDAQEDLSRLIAMQQDQVMSQLALLGAVERARLRHVRNALVVVMPSAALDRARTLEGVRSVRQVRHMHHTTP